MKEKRFVIFYIMCTNSFYPSVTLPITLVNGSCSLTDQISRNLPLPADVVCSRIMVSQLSDHLTCITFIIVLQSNYCQPKFDNIHTNNIESLVKKRNKLSNVSYKLNWNLMTDPNLTYNTLENLILSALDKYMPKRRVRLIDISMK